MGELTFERRMLDVSWEWANHFEGRICEFSFMSKSHFDFVGNLFRKSVFSFHRAQTEMAGKKEVDGEGSFRETEMRSENEWI